jgi:hypothetical protein
MYTLENKMKFLAMCAFSPCQAPRKTTAATACPNRSMGNSKPTLTAIAASFAVRPDRLAGASSGRFPAGGNR